MIPGIICYIIIAIVTSILIGVYLFWEFEEDQINGIEYSSYRKLCVFLGIIFPVTFIVACIYFLVNQLEKNIGKIVYTIIHIIKKGIGG